MFNFLAIRAGLVANLQLLRQIDSKLDTLQSTMDANQQQLDDTLAQLKTQIGETAQRVSEKLGSLVQSSPTFNSEITDLQQDLAALAAIAPAAQAANASTSTHGLVKDGATVDAHPEIVAPPGDPVGVNPANTDTTPQVQKDAQPFASANAAPANQPTE